MQSWRSLWLALLICFMSLTAGCKPESVDIYGRPIRLSDYRGKWVVIHYWTTWCAPCIQQIPELIKLVQYYPKQTVVLGVNPDNLDNKVLQELAEEYQINYAFLKQFPIEKLGGKKSDLPVTYIINPQGKLVNTITTPLKLSDFQTILNLPPIAYP